jgi:hypothetical protein
MQQQKFETMSNQILERNIYVSLIGIRLLLCLFSNHWLIFFLALDRLLDEMGARVDEMEKTIGELMKQTRLDQQVLPIPQTSASKSASPQPAEKPGPK